MYWKQQANKHIPTRKLHQSTCSLVSHSRILNRQDVLNQARVSSQKLKHEVESHAELERTYFSQRSAREQLRTRMELLRRQLAEQQATEDEGKKGGEEGDIPCYYERTYPRFFLC